MDTNLFHCLGGGESAVVRDRAVYVVHYVRRADVMMQQVKNCPIWPVD